MQSLLKWGLAPAFALGLLICADVQSARAQFGISIGIGSPVVRTSSYGYGGIHSGYSGIHRGYGGVYHSGYVNRSSYYSPYSIGVPVVRYQSYSYPSVRTQYYSPRSSHYSPRSSYYSSVRRPPAVIVPRVRYGSRRRF